MLAFDINIILKTWKLTPGYKTITQPDTLFLFSPLVPLRSFSFSTLSGLPHRSPLPALRSSSASRSVTALNPLKSSGHLCCGNVLQFGFVPWVLMKKWSYPFSQHQSQDVCPPVCLLPKGLCFHVLFVVMLTITTWLRRRLSGFSKVTVF